MRKILIIFSIGILAGTYSYCRDGLLLRTDEQVQIPRERRIPDASDVTNRAKEFLEIQRKLFDMERNVIQQDQELKQLAEQIKQLQQQLREKVEERLKINEEYQSLKQRREQIRQEYIKGNLKPKEPPINKFERR